MKVLLVGNGGREHAIGEAIKRSAHNPELVVFANRNNPGLCKHDPGRARKRGINIFRIIMQICLGILLTYAGPRFF